MVFIQHLRTLLLCVLPFPKILGYFWTTDHFFCLIGIRGRGLLAITAWETLANSLKCVKSSTNIDSYVHQCYVPKPWYGCPVFLCHMPMSCDTAVHGSEINVFLLLSDSHLSLTHTPLTFPWSRTNVGIWNFTCLPAIEQWCTWNAKTGSRLQPPNSLPWSKTFASLLACVADRCITQTCMSRLHTPSVRRLSPSRHSRDLHTPAPLLMSELIIRCTGPVRQCFIYPPRADVKIMIH